MTCGLVRMMSASPTEDEHIATLIPLFKILSAKTIHPLLLPVLTYAMWHDVLRIQHRLVHDSLTSVQYSTGLMRSYLHYEDDDPLQNTPAEDYSTIHAKIVTQHAFLTTALSAFVVAAGQGLDDAMKTIGETTSPGTQILVSTSDLHDELALHITHISRKVKREMEHRDILLGKVQMQLQVVCYRHQGHHHHFARSTDVSGL
jgi:hypothetical protein